MAKTVPESKFVELAGLDRISIVIHGMKCLFREITKDDFGIDGEIEVVVPKPDGKGYETTGGIIKVQSKSGASYVKQDSPTHFSTPVEKNDLETWYSATHPVIFIVYHPGEDKLYWKDVRSYVRSTPNVWQPPLKIDFDKTADEFTTAVYPAISSLGQVSPPRVSGQQKERLYSNLLLVKRLPLLMTSAVTRAKDYHEIRGNVRGFVPPFCIVEDRLFTLSDLRHPGCVLRDFCDISRVNDVPAEQWIRDEVRRRDYVFLLNQLLGTHLYRCGLKYNKHFDRNYFPRRDTDGTHFKQDWYNVRTGRNAPARTVVRYYTYGRDSFWRHLAAKVDFRIIGSYWYLQLIPKYFFTVDGETPYDRDKIGPYTTRLKANERNIHVLNHVLFWADVISMRNPAIELKLDGKTAMVIEKTPVSATANFAIPYDPVIYEEDEDPTPQVSLFDMFLDRSQDPDMGEDDDEYQD